MTKPRLVSALIDGVLLEDVDDQGQLHSSVGHAHARIVHASNLHPTPRAIYSRARDAEHDIIVDVQRALDIVWKTRTAPLDPMLVWCTICGESFEDCERRPDCPRVALERIAAAHTNRVDESIIIDSIRTLPSVPVEPVHVNRHERRAAKAKKRKSAR